MLIESKWIVMAFALFGAEFCKSQPEEENYDLSDEEIMECFDLFYPAIYKNCITDWNQGYLRSADQCAQQLALDLPCSLEWIREEADTDYHNCTGQSDSEYNRWNQAREKCFDACTAKRMNLITDDGTLNTEACISFLEEVPMFRDRPLSDKIREELINCIENDYSFDNSSEISDPECKLGSQIIRCLWNAEYENGLETCVLRACEPKFRSPKFKILDEEKGLRGSWGFGDNVN